MNRPSRCFVLPLAASVVLALAPGVAAHAQRYCIPAPIPVPERNEPVMIPFNVSASGNIADVDVELETTHQHAGDLYVMLDMHGRVIRLLDHSLGMPPNEIGCQGSTPRLIFDDEGTLGSAQFECRQQGPAYLPPGGRFLPAQPLSVFDGLPATGTFVVAITDPFPGDPGAVMQLCLELTTTIPDLIFADDFN